MSSRRVPNPIPSARRGFSLVEMLITLTVLATVMIVLMTVMYSAQRSKAATSNQVESTQGARIAMDMMARDLRSAGYGADLDWLAAPQPPIAYIDSLTVLINADMSPWPDSLPGHPMGVPQAYQPAGLPKPCPPNGPVPPGKLADIARVVVNVSAGSADADVKGKIAVTSLRTEISSMRNVPNFGAATYTVDGAVFNDADKSGTRNGGEAGISGATVRLGALATTTGPNGDFLFRVEHGTYTTRH